MSRSWSGAVMAMGVVGLLGAVIPGSGWGPGAISAIKGVAIVVPEPEPRAPWTRRLALVDEALGEGSPGRAIYEWREAYGAARGTRRWEPMLAVADAAMRIDGALPRPGQFRPEARRAYLAALFLARQQGSPEGIARAVEAFERLGDADTARQARRMLERSS